MTTDKSQVDIIPDEELVKQIAWMAWKGAANAYRLYPDNNHTFTDYWSGAKNQFYEFKTLIAGRSKTHDEKEQRVKELEEGLREIMGIFDRQCGDEPEFIFVARCINEMEEKAKQLLNK